MERSEIREICRMVERGGKLLVRRDYMGNSFAKVTWGPFHMFAKRFQCGPEQMQELHEELAKSQRTANLSF
jgi:hypothetical protein